MKYTMVFILLSFVLHPKAILISQTNAFLNINHKSTPNYHLDMLSADILGLINMMMKDKNSYLKEDEVFWDLGSSNSLLGKYDTEITLEVTIENILLHPVSPNSILSLNRFQELSSAYNYPVYEELSIQSFIWDNLNLLLDNILPPPKNESIGFQSIMFHPTLTQSIHINSGNINIEQNNISPSKHNFGDWKFRLGVGKGRF